MGAKRMIDEFLVGMSKEDLERQVVALRVQVLQLKDQLKERNKEIMDLCGELYRLRAGEARTITKQGCGI